MAQYHHVTSYNNFFESPEEDINYIHASFDRVRNIDPTLTNICYSLQADAEAEIFFGDEVQPDYWDAVDILLEDVTADIARNPAIKVFIVDGKDFVTHDGRTEKMDLGWKWMADFFTLIAESKSIDEIKFINCRIDNEDATKYFIEESPESTDLIKINFENCQLTSQALQLFMGWENVTIIIRVAKCTFDDENGFIHFFKRHFLPSVKNVNFIVFNKCRFSERNISMLAKLADDRENIADLGFDATGLIKFKMIQ